MYHQLSILILKRQNIQKYLCIIPYVKQDTRIAEHEILVGNYERTWLAVVNGGKWTWEGEPNE